jgi:hypothetical protein
MRHDIKREVKEAEQYHSEFLHHCQCIFHLSTTSLSLTLLLQEETCYSFVDMDNLDADVDIMYLCPSITSPSEYFYVHTRAQLERTRSSDCLALAFSNWIAFVGKALDCAVVLIIPGRWRNAVQEAEIGDIAYVKVGEQKQNTTCFYPDRP